MNELKDAGSKSSGTAVGEIERIVREAVKPGIISAPLEPAGSYFISKPDGSLELKTAKAGWHNEKLETPAMLLRYVQDDEENTIGRLFLNESQVVYLLNAADRRDRATCELKLTPQFDWLANRSATMMSQADLVKLLRITMRGCLGDGSGLVTLFRDLDFKVTQEGKQVIQQGRESMGKSIAAAVNAKHEIPEEFALSVPVFENHPITVRIACAIEVMTQEQKFRLTPFPQEITNGMETALDSIWKMFAAAGEDHDLFPKIYRGHP